VLFSKLNYHLFLPNIPLPTKDVSCVLTRKMDQTTWIWTLLKHETNTTVRCEVGGKEYRKFCTMLSVCKEIMAAYKYRNSNWSVTFSLRHPWICFDFECCFTQGHVRDNSRYICCSFLIFLNLYYWKSISSQTHISPQWTHQLHLQITLHQLQLLLVRS